MSDAPAGAPAGAAVEVAEAALREHLDDTVLRDKKLPFVSITVARRGAVVFEHAVTAPDQAPFVLSSRSVLRVYSMTKVVVSVAALTLVDAGKLDLDAPISRYLPEWDDAAVTVLEEGAEAAVPSERKITVRNLMTHTAGLVYRPDMLAGMPVVAMFFSEEPGWMEVPASLAEWATRVVRVPLVAQPGTQFMYGHAFTEAWCCPLPWSMKGN